ncbi:hypothetical protein K3495_g4648 [Podosphaera aphanis]|nr:hypothetical protein K3495_g4648 [Podosphaera aphanis]
MSEAMNEFPLLSACKNSTASLNVTKSQPDAIAAEIDTLIARYNTSIERAKNTANVTCNIADKAAATLVSVARSPPHPVAGPFTGEKRKLLPVFLKQLKLKFRQNDDWWPTEQKGMGYVLSQLCGPALAQFDDQNEDGLINFTEWTL